MVVVSQILFFRDLAATKKNVGGNWYEQEKIRHVYATFLNLDAGYNTRFRPWKPILFLSVVKNLGNAWYTICT